MGGADTSDAGTAVVEQAAPQPAAAAPAPRTQGRGRRVAGVALLVAVPVCALSVELGGLAAVSRSLDDARSLRDAGQYPQAIAAFAATAERGGPVFLLARSKVDEATQEVARTTLQWAGALAASGQVDAALDIATRVTTPDLAAAARRSHAQIALDAATAASAAGRFDEALHRLDQLRDGAPPDDLAVKGEQLRPAVEVGAAAHDVAAGRAAEAVPLLDDALRRSPSGDVAARVLAALPQALLAAGSERSAAGDPEQARELLQRCVDSFASSGQAARARALLSAPQPVTGTLVRHDGSPAADTTVRLGGGYHRVGSAGFTLSGPFLSARTDASGSFRIDRVPLGTTLVFEFLDSSGWELIVDESRAPAYSVDLQPLAPVDLGYVREP